jgi:hypothetical protein
LFIWFTTPLCHSTTSSSLLQSLYSMRCLSSSFGEGHLLCFVRGAAFSFAFEAAAAAAPLPAPSPPSPRSSVPEDASWCAFFYGLR